MHQLHVDDTPDHLLARVDARVKVVCALALLVMVVSSGGFRFPLVVASVCLVLCAWLRVKPRRLLVRFAEPAFIATTVVILKMFFSGSVPLGSWNLGPLHLAVHADGLREGLLIAFRIAAAVSLVSTVGFATSFTDIMAAFAWLRVPRGLVEVSLFAWRYLFVLFEDAAVVYAAQKNRLGYAGFRQGLSSFGTLAGTLVIKAFDNSQTLTTAMSQRGYDGTLPHLTHEPLKTCEVTVGMLAVAVMGVFWVL